jgi:hypothetical protein
MAESMLVSLSRRDSAASFEGALRFLKSHPACACCKNKSTIITTHPRSGERIALCRDHNPSATPSRPAGSGLASMKAQLDEAGAARSRRARALAQAAQSIR